MLEELDSAREEENKRTVSMKGLVQKLYDILDAPLLVANEEAMFASMMNLLKYIKLNQLQY